MPSRSERRLNNLIRWYQDETGIMEYQHTAVAKWLERKGYKMPQPPTAVDLLAKRLARAARADMRPLDGTAIEYRGQLAYPRTVNEQCEMFWFDADGPAATRENVTRALRMRQNQAINLGVRAKADAMHFAATHPGEQIPLDWDLDDDVTWRLNAPGANEEEKAG